MLTRVYYENGFNRNVYSEAEFNDAIKEGAKIKPFDNKDTMTNIEEVAKLEKLKKDLKEKELAIKLAKEKEKNNSIGFSERMRLAREAKAKAKAENK